MGSYTGNRAPIKKGRHDFKPTCKGNTSRFEPSPSKGSRLRGGTGFKTRRVIRRARSCAREGKEKGPRPQEGQVAEAGR